MNSITIGAASAGHNLGLLGHSRSLSASRHSVARSIYASSSNMNAAVASSRGGQGKGGNDGHDDHPIRLAPKGNDPISLRTVTVDDSFRRMEELVGSEEEEKNWKGIVIALVVIAVILGLIATAIVLVTPPPDKYDPGESLTFSMLTDETLQLRTPVFSWVKGSDNFYTFYNNYQLNTTDKFVRRFVTLENASASESSRSSILVPQDVLSSKLRGLESVEASPNTNYALTQLDVDTDSITTKSFYKIYDHHLSSILEVDKSSEKLQYATWIGSQDELLYVKNNNIYYKVSAGADSTPVTTDGSSSVLYGVADRLYKVYILPDEHSLIWPSPHDSKFVFARIELSAESSYKEPDSQADVVIQDLPTSSSLTVHLFSSGSSDQLNLPVSTGYLTAVSWMDEDRVMIVWLSKDHKSEKYFICNCRTKQCSLNYEYMSSNANLNWVGMYGTPIFNGERNEYYILLPDPANEKKLYRHIATIKVNEAERKEPSETFLTHHSWSDSKLLRLVGNRLYYLSTGANHTHQHLYSVTVDTRASRCWTCEDFGLGIASYVEAEFSSNNSYVYLSILGPNMPTYHIIDMNTWSHEPVESIQLDKEHSRALELIYENIKLPIVEYVTIPLDNNVDASVKLVLPSIFNRNKSCLYELVIVVDSLPGERAVTQKFTLDYYDYLAKNQTYIVAYVDVGGSGGRGEHVRQVLNGSIGFSEGHDITRIISYLEIHYKHYKVDKNYVAVIGNNYGGFVSLHAMANHGVIKCGVVTSPLISFPTYGQWLLERYMGGSTNTRLNYDCTESSALCSTPHSNTTLLLIHGTANAVVPVQNSFSLMMELQMANYDFRQQIYPNIGNDLESADVSSHYYQTILNYLHECFEIRLKVKEDGVDYCENR